MQQVAPTSFHHFASSLIDSSVQNVSVTVLAAVALVMQQVAPASLHHHAGSLISSWVQNVRITVLALDADQYAASSTNKPLSSHR